MDLSKLPLRHTDYAGRLILLQNSGLFQGDAETGFRLSSTSSLTKLSEQVGEPIENFVGFMPIPVGLATNFLVNGRALLVPIASEEHGIVSGCSKAAGLCRPDGFNVEASFESTMKGQILFSFSSFADACGALSHIKQNIKHALSEIFSSMPKHQRPVLVGHTSNFLHRPTSGDDNRIVVNLIFNTGEKMGAGMVTRLTEKVAHKLAGWTGRPATASICSNKDAGWMVRAQALWPIDVIGRKTAESTVAMQEWAEADPDRAATHIKGIMNAISGIATATGQDERAVAATAYAYAAKKSGGLSPLTSYRIIGKTLKKDLALQGEMVLRISVGTKGGAADGAFAKLFRHLMLVDSSRELACVMAAGGLAANFAALACLVNEGISAGHAKTRKI